MQRLFVFVCFYYLFRTGKTPRDVTLACCITEIKWRKYWYRGKAIDYRWPQPGNILWLPCFINWNL